MINQACVPRLRRLEIQGFKSFASRTVFELGCGITAVVGPNGSGKSNVADAFRWVLGEQGVRSLRLRKPEDVIFAGGGKRGPAGFAEVSVVLDNSDGRLPLAFGELLVSRRLHRSGESEYLINRRRVRLRDVVDLFSAARLGQNSYAILGQGMVDAVLSLRPEERRGLIEDAADVRRFRLRIDEAMGQLSDTRANRDRVELLLGEIAPRLGQLERQAKRAAEHARLAARLAGYLRSLHLGRWQAARERTAGAIVEFERATRALAEAATRLQCGEERLGSLREALAEARRQLETAEIEGGTLRGRLREAEQKLEQLRDQHALVTQRRNETEKDLDGLLAEAAGIEAEEPASRDSDEALRQAAASVAGQEAAVDRLAQPVAAAQDRFAAAETEQRRLEREASEAGERHARLLRERRQIEQEAVRLVQRRQDALKRLAVWARDFREATHDVRQVDARLPAAQQELADLTRQTQAAAAARDERERRLTEIERSLDDGRRRLEPLEHQRETRRPAEERLLTLLNALRGAGPGRPKLLGVLGGLIQVQRGLEVAVEAALAGALDAVVVRGASEALGAVRTLQEIEAGRLSFYSLDTIHGGHVLNLSTESGILGVAASFVRCDEAYRDLIDSLLGRVVVVEDIEAAERVARRGLGAAVTRDGVLLSPGGLVSGGRGKTDGYVFRAAREVEELRAAIERIDADRKVATAELAEARTQARDAAERAKRARGVHDDLTARRRAAEPTVVRLRRRLEPLRGELEWLRGASVESLGRRESLEPEEGRLRDAAARLRAAAEAQAGGALQAARLAREKLLAQRSQLVRTLDEARAAVRSLERERDALAVLHESRRAARERTARLVSGRRQGMLESDAELVRLGDAIRCGDEHLASQRQALSAWPGRRDPLHTGVQALLAEETAQAERIVALRGERTMLERGRLDAELALRRAQQEQAQAEEALEAELGMTAVDAASAGNGNAGSLSLEELEKQVREIRTRIRGMGAVNAEAESDYRETHERYEFLSGQIADLKQAEGSLLEAMDELRGIVHERFAGAFTAINAGFERYFRGFFGGGQARLILTEPGSSGDAGVDIVAQPPGKRLQNLTMLSGGERSMTSVALLFALLENDPAPFCVLDEVDAALDEANVGRVGRALTDLAHASQFLVITHNRGTVQAANQIYGVSMNEDGISTVLSMRLDDAAPLLQ